MHTTTKSVSLVVTFLCLVLKQLEAVDIFSAPQEFCYTDPECGPESDEWTGVCHTGVRQSPINLQLPHHRLPTRFTYFPLEQFGADHFFVQNNGHTVNLDFTPVGEGSQFFPGYGLSSAKYRFTNAHFHWGPTDRSGSEHQLNGSNLSMEVHLVHVKDKYQTVKQAVASGDGNALSVIGIFLQVSPTAKPNPALAPLISILETVHETHTFWVRGDTPIDLMPLIPKRPGSTIVSYKGSLTTPTCDEVVNWYVFTDPVPIASSDLTGFRKVMDGREEPLQDNRRPVQALNGRRIETIIVA